MAQDYHKSGMYGKHHTAETRAKMSASRTGIKNHFLGKRHTEEAKQKMSLAHLGERASNWKGDAVGYSCLHKWVARHKPKPDVCEICRAKPPRDLANVSGEYRRDVNDFRWLCSSCHSLQDGTNKLPKERGRKHGRWALRYDQCTDCGTTTRRHVGKGLCYTCYRYHRHGTNHGILEMNGEIRYPEIFHREGERHKNE